MRSDRNSALNALGAHSHAVQALSRGICLRSNLRPVFIAHLGHMFDHQSGARIA